MTATPIPRTLGLTLYGELDLSVLDELPAGRQPVKTFVRGRESLPKVWQFIKEKLAEGRQAFVVYPRVEETQNVEVKAVKQEFARVSEAVAPFRAELLHGSLAPEVKEVTMREFRAGRIHVLLATSLIEVGVDVPNATVMLIENADQFGLAQLHQLRGRIGRGQHGSYCILIAEDEAPDEQERLEVLATVSDGFKLAEADLKFRGPGEFLGHRQSGLPQFRFGDLNCDLELIRFARDLAKEETAGN